MSLYTEEKTRSLILLEKAKHILSAKWVYRFKGILTETGSECQLQKARLIARVFLQIKETEYDKTFAPIVAFPTLRLLSLLVAEENLGLYQIDVITTLRYGELDKEIFMEHSNILVNEEKSDCVFKLNRDFYGLKQAPRQWFAIINSFLKYNLGMQSYVY